MSKRATSIRNLSGPEKMRRVQNKAMRLTAASLTAAAMLTTACGSRHGGMEYAGFAAPEKSRWMPGQAFDFSPMPADSNPDGRLFTLTLALRHSEKLQFRRFPVEITLTDGDGNVSIDTISVTTADSDGHWTGTGTHGLYFVTKDIASGFRPASDVTVSVASLAELPIEGINRVGIMLADTKTNQQNDPD